MMLFRGDTQIEYSMTAQGSMLEHHKCGNVGFVRATNDPERFLRWMIQAEVNKDIERRRRETLLGIVSPWWTARCNPDTLRGTFNTDLYFRVINAKIDKGELQW